MTFGPLIGAAQLAIGRGTGIAWFGNSVAAFMASLAPLIAFPLVGGAALLMAGAGALPVVSLLVLTLISQLGPAVLSHTLARRWGREAPWLRYATACNWCQLTIPVAAMVFAVMIQLGSGGTLPERTITRLLFAFLVAYVLWLNWTIARHGLALSRVRAGGLVLLVNLGTAALIAVPELIAWALDD